VRTLLESLKPLKSLESLESRAWARFCHGARARPEREPDAAVWSGLRAGFGCCMV